MEDVDVIQTGVEQQEGSQLDLGKYIKAIWKRKWLLVLCAILVSVPFYLQAKNQIPIYSALVTIKTREFDQNSKGLLDRDRQIELKSRTFAEQVTAQMGLALLLDDDDNKNREHIFYEFSTSTHPVPGRYRMTVEETGHYRLFLVENQKEIPLDSANVWDAVTNSRDINGFAFRLNPDIVHSTRQINFRIRPFAKAVSEMMSGINVRFSNSGDFMVIEGQGIDPDALPDKLNQIAEVYVQETLRLKSRDVSNKQRTLEKRLDAAETETKKADAALRGFYERYPLSLDAEKKGVVDELQTCNRALREIPRQREQLTQLLDRLEETQQGPDPEQYRRFIVHQMAEFQGMSTEPAMAILKERLLSEEKKYDELLADFAPDYPPSKELAASIFETQSSVIAFASRYRNTLAGMESEFRQKMEKIQAQMKKFPYDESELMELERNKRISDDLYNMLYSELQKLQVSDLVASDEISILDRAIRPNYPINASKKKKIILGGGLGLMLGVLFSVILELSDKSIKSVEDIEKHLHLRAIGAIPIVDFKNIAEYQDFEKAKQIDRQLVTHDYSPTPIGESYRALRTHLMFSKTMGKIHTLLITSISPEEGKSFTSSNLAIILAQQRSNTLLVDADLRRGVLHNTFSMQKEPGLTNYLTNIATLSAVVQQTHIPNLSIISCGSMIPNPSELLGSLQMRRFFEEARRKFDFILFDTPPLDAATDSVVLGTQVDAVAVVVFSGKTNRNLAKEKLEIFQTVPANVIGVILNGSDSSLVQHSYSYYHY
jgi:capsular exopolysaccharide synthesis family protein